MLFMLTETASAFFGVILCLCYLLNEVSPWLFSFSSNLSVSPPSLSVLNLLLCVRQTFFLNANAALVV
jgi:hypothetical protein